MKPVGRQLNTDNPSTQQSDPALITITARHGKLELKLAFQAKTAVTIPCKTPTAQENCAVQQLHATLFTASFNRLLRQLLQLQGAKDIVATQPEQR